MNETWGRSRLLGLDILGVGSIGLRTRRLRAALSAIGVAIGIASMVAVLGISASSQKELLDRIDRLGTNLLTVAPGESLFGEQAELPKRSAAKASAVSGVSAISAIYDAPDATVRRSEYVDEVITRSIEVKASDFDLPQTLSGQMASGRYLDAVTGRYPSVVLGSVAAQRLGISAVKGRPQVYIDDRYYVVIGILATLTLAEDLDRAAFVGLAQGQHSLEIEANPTTATRTISSGASSRRSGRIPRALARAGAFRGMMMA